jgi:hypothetical protein
MFKNTIAALAVPFLSACAIMHHTQIGEVDSRVVAYGQPFEILLSEVGVNLQEAGEILKATTRNSNAHKNIEGAQAIIALFQMGPKTGNPVYSDDYADPMFNIMRTKCPSGIYSGLTVVRETNKYPVVSGEIVKIKGYCMMKKNMTAQTSAVGEN